MLLIRRSLCFLSSPLINFTRVFFEEILSKTFISVKFPSKLSSQFTSVKIENDKNKQERMNQRFYNLSLKQILNNLSLTLIKIMNEISIYMEKSDRTTKELIDIFTKDDRMIYVGILLIILSLGIFFINISS